MKANMTKGQMVNSLREKKCNVVFKKVDGSIREMECTLQKDHLPIIEERRASESISRSMSSDVIPVWDLGKMSWRSFRVASVINFEPIEMDAKIVPVTDPVTEDTEEVIEEGEEVINNG